MDSHPSTQHLRRHRTTTHVRHRTTSVRRRHTASIRKPSASSSWQTTVFDLQQTLRRSRRNKRILVKIILLVIALIVPLYLMGLGGVYLAYHWKPDIHVSSPDDFKNRASDREFHVINGKVIMLKKTKDGVMSE